MPDSARLAGMAAGLFALAAAVSWWRARKFLSRVLRAQGRITHFIAEESQHWKGEGQGSDTETAYLPHVEFWLPDGSRIAFQSRVRKTSQVLQGCNVTVVYDPGSPATSAEIEGLAAWFVAWRAVIVMTALSLAALLIAWLAGQG